MCGRTTVIAVLQTPLGSHLQRIRTYVTCEIHHRNGNAEGKSQPKVKFLEISTKLVKQTEKQKHKASTSKEKSLADIQNIEHRVSLAADDLLNTRIPIVGPS